MLIFHTWCAMTDTLTYVPTSILLLCHCDCALTLTAITVCARRYEFLKTTDLPYLKDFGPCDLPFSLGQCRNFFHFFVVQPGWCISTKDWLPTKYAPPEQYYRNSPNVCMNPWENKYYRCC